MKRQVVINGRFLTRMMTGVERTGMEMVRALEQMIESKDPGLDQFEFTLVMPRSEPSSLTLKNIRIESKGRLSGHLWEQLQLPFYARGKILVNFCNTAPIFFKNQLVTIHDASIYAIPATYSFLFRFWYRFMFWCLKRNARKILTDSKFSKDELIKFAHIDEQKIEVVPLAADHVHASSKDDSIFLRRSIGQRPFLFCVGSQAIHKNMMGFLKALRLVNSQTFDVVMAGAKNSKVFSKVDPLIEKNVVFLGRITDGELYAIYEKATCFVFPSLYEGFGMPPLEAMESGCPVISSRVASLPEVCGEAAEYCDPHNEQDIANKISKIMNDRDLQKRLSDKGRVQAQKFSWRKSAGHVVQQLEQLCALP